MKNFKRYIYLLLLSLAVIGVIVNSGCSSSDNPSGPNLSNDSIYVNIVYDDATKVFKDSDLSSLNRIDTANQVYYFDASNSLAASLQEGDNVVVGTYSYFKVKSITNTGSEIEVEGEFAPLTDVVKDAEIDWDYTVSFEREKFMEAFISKGATLQTATSDSLGFSFKFPPFEYSIGIKFSNEKVNLTIIAEKVIADTKVAKLTVTGELRKFKTTGKIKIQDHVLQDFNAGNNFQEVEFGLKVSAAGSGNDIGISVPLPLLKFPIAGIPFIWFEIKCLVVMNAMVPPPESSTLLDYKFKYNADMGLQYDKSSNSCNYSTNLKSDESQEMSKPHAASASIMTMNWGIAVPRFEINVGVPEFLNTTVGWFSTAYLVNGFFQFNPACQEAKVGFYGDYGWELGAFGMSFASGGDRLWSKEKVYLKAGNCD
ncbi:MAG: hypothetical protein A2X61_03265 [Ignavibacteria bacterium GWB2_35_12]|nr:MAG: hypothetical protein A2X63_05365 [Ignavibacteria bacterium GWA2_35_8]OGU38302.1 MAG: hypothetical protein A2X61_03265 [Ignavibacteria bacterium GWB2_35_12]OGU89602.1 MAG: hypothetical protein A2220_11585 [Ignavibacteria bacterium RIFOXYA2_FULL_35_10]OGV20759.1 MAG: hypothetical protein A2475_11280 [Ignavibacteria bacterium RIFOXYC2_FULL_35_21]